MLRKFFSVPLLGHFDSLKAAECHSVVEVQAMALQPLLAPFLDHALHARPM
jgi:hypothetical protein